jgi:hypothetical protein
LKNYAIKVLFSGHFKSVIPPNSALKKPAPISGYL